MISLKTSPRRFQLRPAILALLGVGVLGLPLTALAGETVIGLSTTNTLVRFDSDTPGTIADSVAVTGLQSSEDLLGIDFRPATNVLFGLGSTGRVYTINLDTGAATQVGSTALTLTGTVFGFDFNPVPDRIRVVSEQEFNIRVNPDTGVLAATDTSLAYDAGDTNNGANPNIVGAAYTTNTVGGGATTLFGIDSTLDIVVRQGSPNGSPTSPNAGTLFTVGSLGIDTTDNVGFDVAPGTSGRALASLTTTGDATSKLYSVDLGGGRVSLIGAIGTTAAALIMRDIAIVRAGALALSQASYAVSESATSLTVTVQRFGSSVGPSPSGTPTPVAVTLTTSNGTATAGADYTAATTAVSFADGEVSKDVAITLTDDTKGEGNETFTVTLGSESGGAVIRDSGSAVVTILENDLTPTFPDSTGPSVLVAFDDSIKARKLVSPGLTSGISCNEACSLVVQVVANASLSRRLGLGSSENVIGTTTASLTAAGKTSATVKITSASVGRRLRSLVLTRNVSLTLKVIATDGESNVTTETDTLTVTK